MLLSSNPIVGVNGGEGGSGSIVEAYNPTRGAPYIPEVVRISYPIPNSDMVSFGSGTFITRQDILTAAHVVDSNDDFRWTGADQPLTVYTSMGADLLEPGRVSYRVTGVTIHPGYRKYTNGTAINDLAIVHIETMTSLAIPIPIYRGVPRAGDIVDIIGFGKTGVRDVGGLVQNGNKRQIGVAQLDKITAQTIGWTLDQRGEGITASGDSGGPSLIYVNKKAFVAGVTSYGSILANRTGAQATHMRVDAYASWIDSVLATYSSTGPTVTVERHDNITSPASVQYNLRLKYADVNGVNENNLSQPHIALIGPNNYYNQNPIIGLVNRSTDGQFLTVDYRFNGPGGTWSSAENGNYQVVVLNRGLTDSLGNATGASVVTNFNVSLAADVSPPTATLRSTPSTLTVGGKTKFSFVVRYQDNFGIRSSTLGNDVRIVKSDGTFAADARLTISNTIRNFANMDVIYEITPPGGFWDSGDNGVYNIILQPGAVRDTSGNSLAGSVLGSVTVNIPSGGATPPFAILNAPKITSPVNGYTFTVTYIDDGQVNASTIAHSDRILVEHGAGQALPDFATLVSLSPNANNSTIVATYRFEDWTSAANGTFYNVFLSSGGFVNPVRDTSGNAMSGGYLGAFEINIGGSGDASVPRAFANAQDVQLGGAYSQLMSAIITDDVGVQATTVSAGSFAVIGPDNTEYPVELERINYGNDDLMLQVALTMEPPGGAWDSADNGYYRLVVRGETISDLNGNMVSGYESSSEGELVVFLASIGSESTVEPLEGDYNADGAVDAADYAVWRNAVGSETAPYSESDGDGSGIIDQGDYAVWKRNFGRSLVSIAGEGATGFKLTETSGVAPSLLKSDVAPVSLDTPVNAEPPFAGHDEIKLPARGAAAVAEPSRPNSDKRGLRGIVRTPSAARQVPTDWVLDVLERSRSARRAVPAHGDFSTMPCEDDRESVIATSARDRIFEDFSLDVNCESLSDKL